MQKCSKIDKAETESEIGRKTTMDNKKLYIILFFFYVGRDNTHTQMPFIYRSNKK